jgi:hypothetical protein
MPAFGRALDQGLFHELWLLAVAYVLEPVSPPVRVVGLWRPRAGFGFRADVLTWALSTSCRLVRSVTVGSGRDRWDEL